MRVGPGGGRGNFDPAQFQQRMMDNVRQQLGFTNDTDWAAVQPLIQKVMDVRREVGFGGGMGRLFGRNRGGNGGPGGGRGGFGSPPARRPRRCKRRLMTIHPRADQKRAGQYETSQKAGQARLFQAQEDLRKVLTVKQEAQATLLGLLQ